jgi:hypothetical protein
MALQRKFLVIGSYLFQLKSNREITMLPRCGLEKGIPETEVNYTKHINLFHSEPFGNTYEVPIVPENYGNLDDHKTGKYAYLRTDYLINLNGTAVAN